MSSSGTEANTQPKPEDGLLKRMWRTILNFFAWAWAAVKELFMGEPRIELPNLQIELPVIQPMYHVIPDAGIEYDLLQRCANVYNESYGRWGPGSDPIKVGKRMKTSGHRLFQTFNFAEKQCFLSVVQVSGTLAGYMFFLKFPYLEGEALWITQLVVAKDHRGKGYASGLIYSALSSVAEPVAIGMTTSHPYAVRALESATGQKVIKPDVIAKCAPEMIAAAKIPFLQKLPIVGGSIKTNFFVDHSEALAILDQQEDWQLGGLKNGDEFVAIVLLITVLEF